MNEVTKRPATPAQAKILNAIRIYMQENGYSPSVRELGEMVGLSSSMTVHTHLVNMRERGLIVYNGVRQIRVLQ